MSTPLSPPYRIGGLNVHCFHNCKQAAAIHAELKKLHIDAAVVDHAFIISPLQLAVAFFRVEANADGAAAPPSPHAAATSAGVPPRRTSFSRRIFAALSITHNLDRILQILPPGPQTSSVVILYRSPLSTAQTLVSSPAPAAAEAKHTTKATTSSSSSSVVNSDAPAAQEATIEAAIQRVVSTTNPAAAAHRFCAISEPFWWSTAVQYADMGRVVEFYDVPDATLQAARQSMTRSDVLRVCAAAAEDTESSRWAALRWYALEMCVTTQLAACTA